jgi:hypothetical protein
MGVPMSREENLNIDTRTVSHIEISADRNLRPIVTWSVVRGGHSMGGGAGVSSGERDGGGRRW